MHTAIRALATGAATAIAVGVLGSGGAYAGEVTGTGESLKDDAGHLKGASICAFSGLNDTYTGDPDVPDEDGFTRTQSWGQLDKATKEFLTMVGAHPGQSCKPGGGGH
jgi:hypothetical protein